MLNYFNYFLSYSFLGFLLETFFSFIIKGRLESRKCLLLSTLCPVYGLGAIAILKSTEKVKNSKTKTFALGMFAATFTELATDVFYKYILGTGFWNYTNQPFNFNGSICLKYSLIWGVLSLVLVYRIHPIMEKNITKIPKGASVALLLIFIADALASAFLLKTYGNKNAIKIAWIVNQIKSS